MNRASAANFASPTGTDVVVPVKPSSIKIAGIKREKQNSIHPRHQYAQKNCQYHCTDATHCDLTSDYRWGDGKKRWRVKRRRWCHYIGLYFLIQNTQIIIPKKRTVQPRDISEDTAFKPGFEIVKI
jgi:hypothetical protein